MENYTQMKIFLLFIPIIFTAYASVSLYEDKDFKRETGLKFYHSKPYLLVEKSFQKDVLNYPEASLEVLKQLKLL